MNLYIESKQKKSFIKRRAKLIRNHWRNGIAGVETTDPTQNEAESLLDKEKQVLSSGDPIKLQTYYSRLDARKDSKCRFREGF